MGGVFMVGVSAENRASAGVAGRDEVDVDIELDTSPREVTVPPDLAKALKLDAKARKAFEALSAQIRSESQTRPDGRLPTPHRRSPGWARSGRRPRRSCAST